LEELPAVLQGQGKNNELNEPCRTFRKMSSS